jgi:hypothetical protein
VKHFDFIIENAFKNRIERRSKIDNTRRQMHTNL